MIKFLYQQILASSGPMFQTLKQSHQNKNNFKYMEWYMYLDTIMFWGLEPVYFTQPLPTL